MKSTNVPSRVLFALPFLLIIFSLNMTDVHAQTDLTPARFSFDSDGPTLARITSPEEHLGYGAGEQFSFHHDVVDYLKRLSEESDRITMHRYGTTYEGRPLYYLVITSPENHARIDDIRQANVALTSGDQLSSDTEYPAVVWLSYNVHGNEASSTEAAMQVAYWLASAGDDETKTVLTNSVIIIDPCINPDGRDRYVYWYRSMASNIVNTDPAELEHDEPWPGGRTNHYWFDLNRDWIWLVHPESESRIAAYQQWMPHVHVDYHEQGFNSNYFTMPGTTPRNLEIPSEYDEWAEVFGDANARAFDEHNINYATRESFDFFYPGYGSSYPTNMGAIGMLTEQGGHSRGGRAVETDDEYILTLRQRVFDHFLTSMATIETSVERREDLVDYFRSFFASGEDKTTYIFPDDGGSGYLYDMLGILHKHGVEIHRTQSESSLNNTFSYRSGTSGRVSVPAGSFVVSADQPRRVFVNTMLKRDLVLEDSVTYDMTSWSMPLAYNVDGYYRSSGSGMSLESLEAPPARNGAVSGSESTYAYVIDWKQRNAPQALAELWRKEYRVRSVRKSFTAGGKEYSEGTLVVLAGRNLEREASMAGDMAALAEKTNVKIEALSSGLVEKGINLASNNSRPVSRPEVALVVDSPVSSYSAGQIWYMFDQDVQFGIDRIRRDDLNSIDLGKYDVLIVPGFGGSYRSFADSTLLAKLKTWVSDGGVMIGSEQAADMLSEKQAGLTDIKLRPSLQEARKDSSESGTDEEKYLKYSDREKHFGLRRIPGAAFNGVIDTTNPLGFGMSEQVYSLKQRTAALEPAESYQVVGHYSRESSNILASGYASPDEKARLAGSVFAGVKTSGRGKYVLLVDNTQYRYFWLGSSRLLVNATMLLHAL